MIASALGLCQSHRIFVEKKNKKRYLKARQHQHTWSSGTDSHSCIDLCTGCTFWTFVPCTQSKIPDYWHIKLVKGHGKILFSLF